MLPLSEPELQKLLQPEPGPVEAKIALGPNEWCNTLCHDVEKAGEPQELYQKKQDRGGNMAAEGIAGNGRAIDHKNSISASRPDVRKDEVRQTECFGPRFVVGES
jgi:hypothetical protein